MRIGIIRTKENNTSRGTEVAQICKIKSVPIYDIAVDKRTKKRQNSRRGKRLVKKLYENGISVCVAERDFLWLGNWGVTVVSDSFDFFRQRAGRLALQFAEHNGIDADFLITGGRFTEVVEAAKEILKYKRMIYVVNNAFEDIAEAVAEDTGVCISSDIPEKVTEVRMNDEESFLRFGEKEASVSDFSVYISPDNSQIFPGSQEPRLVKILEMGGFLRKNEIKVEYLQK